MEQQALLPHLFRTEYRKIVSVLCSLFGLEYIAIAEDLVSDTFLTAAELWAIHGIPDKPQAWLYVVAKNKARNYLKRNALFKQKITGDLLYLAGASEEMDIDFSEKNIQDSQLAMMFTISDPCIPTEAQVALALNLLCGFGVQELADAFLTSKEAIYKRLSRAKEKLRAAPIKIEQPGAADIRNRIGSVLTTVYLLFNEGYYSVSQDHPLRKEFCAEAMRLTQLLIENESTDMPAVNALQALMCFHASRFDARTNARGELVLYQDQDSSLWNRELIQQGVYFLNRSSVGTQVSRYHLEAGIAYWHTHQEDSHEKWENILQGYNQLLQIAYSPIAALNRTFALAKTAGSNTAIIEAEKLQLTGNHFYYSLLGYLYEEIDPAKALLHYQNALRLAASPTDKAIVTKRIRQLSG